MVRRLVDERAVNSFFAVKGQRFDQLANDAGKIALEVRRVLTLDHVIRDEGEIIADEYPAAKSDTDGEGPTMKRDKRGKEKGGSNVRSICTTRCFGIMPSWKFRRRRVTRR